MEFLLKSLFGAIYYVYKAEQILDFDRSFMCVDFIRKSYYTNYVVRLLALFNKEAKAMKNYIKMNKRQVGTRIWRLVSESAMTVDQIAEFLCLSSSLVIYDWMSGKKTPTLERAYNLARLFNTTIEDVFFQ